MFCEMLDRQFEAPKFVIATELVGSSGVPGSGEETRSKVDHGYKVAAVVLLLLGNSSAAAATR